MEISIFLAKLLGLYLIAVIPAILIHRRKMDSIVAEFSQNIGLVYLSGFVSLILGLLVVLTHNVWVADWPILITILGWLAVLKGLIRFYFPEKLATFAKKFSGKFLVVWCVVFLIVGLYLTCKGFGGFGIVTF